MYLKWTKICAKYLEVLPVEQLINLDFSFTKKHKAGLVAHLQNLIKLTENEAIQKGRRNT